MTNSTTTQSPKIIGKLLDGAFEQFATHGFAKTSMLDIAKASGISRTSLYKYFRTKEEVFAALSKRVNRQVYEAVVSASKTPGLFEERLLAVINARVGWVYELLHYSEYGRELINEKNRVCGGQVLAANDRIIDLLETLFETHINRRNDSITSRLIAKVFVSAVNGVLEQAETKDEAQKRIALLTSLVVRGLLY